MKKIYKAPYTTNLEYRNEALLYVTSLSYGGNNDEPGDDAKASIFEEDSNDGVSYNLPSINYDVWADEEED